MINTNLKKLIDAATILISVGSVSVVLLLISATILGFKPLVVSGGSMAPTFDAGDVLLTRPVDAESIEKNDVITYLNRTRSGLTTHRVDGVISRAEGTFFRTIGDANTTPDNDLVHESFVQAKVLGHIPFGELVVFTYQSWWVSSALIFIPIVIILYRDFADLVNKRRVRPFRESVIASKSS
jgi:signal peptidase